MKYRLNGSLPILLDAPPFNAWRDTRVKWEDETGTHTGFVSYFWNGEKWEKWVSRHVNFGEPDPMCEGCFACCP